MQYRVDPRTGRRLSVLGLGCMRFPGSVPGRPDQRRAEAIIARAVELGVCGKPQAKLLIIHAHGSRGHRHEAVRRHAGTRIEFQQNEAAVFAQHRVNASPATGADRRKGRFVCSWDELAGLFDLTLARDRFCAFQLDERLAHTGATGERVLSAEELRRKIFDLAGASLASSMIGKFQLSVTGSNSRHVYHVAVA